MTWRKRTIMEMAREAGFQTGTRDYANGVGSYPIALPIGYNTCLPELEAFAALVRADERERIAKWYASEGHMMFPVAIPDAIRSNT